MHSLDKTSGSVQNLKKKLGKNTSPLAKIEKKKISNNNRLWEVVA